MFKLLVTVILTFASSVVSAWDANLISVTLKDNDPIVVDRVNSLLNSSAAAKDLSNLDKLSTINRLVNNNIRFQSDFDNWGVSDYWASPGETLTKGYGDCEDYAILKYFALLISGVDQTKLKFIYGRVNGVAHMVLVYYDCSLCDNLILDNLTNEVKPLTTRTDIKPVFQFDNKNSFKIWNDLISKTKSEGFY